MNEDNDNTDNRGDTLSNSSLNEAAETRDIINYTILEVLRELSTHNFSQHNIFNTENVYVNLAPALVEQTLPSTLNPLSDKLINESNNTAAIGESSHARCEHLHYNYGSQGSEHTTITSETSQVQNVPVAPQSTTTLEHHNIGQSISQGSNAQYRTAFNNLNVDNRFGTPTNRCLSDTHIHITCTTPSALSYHGPPPLAGAPPSYSTIIRLGSEEQTWPQHVRPTMRVQPSPPFVAPTPPPSYNEAQGFHLDRPIIVASVFPSFSADQLTWGPSPLSVICPRCAHVVLTRTVSRRSNLTHFSALALCVCGCWPCCLLPYCMDSCKNTYHHCPTCQQLLGTYRPW